MDKAEVEQIANKLLSWYGKPEEEKWTGFTAVLATYGTSSDIGPNSTLTRDAADNLLKQALEKRLPATINDVLFLFKTAWIEDENGSGRIMAEYLRKATPEEVQRQLDRLTSASQAERNPIDPTTRQLAERVYNNAYDWLVAQGVAFRYDEESACYCLDEGNSTH